MRRRGRLWLLVAGAVVVLLWLVWRPAGPTGPDGTPDDPGAGPPAAGTPAGPDRTGPPGSPAPPTPPTGPGAGDTAPPVPSGPPPHDESGVTGGATLGPEGAEAAREVAERFAGLWAVPPPDWPDPVLPLSTPDLAAALAGSDPPQPDRTVTGSALVLFGSPQWARVGVPTADGLVVLDVVEVDGAWLVSAVDWRPG